MPPRRKRKLIKRPVLKKQPDPKPLNAVVTLQVPSDTSLYAKVCRLCETKDGPFLNIFEAEKKIGEKINEVMPFNVTETDELPQKICFRCSAKVEEIDEYIQKCIKTQSNLYSSLGKKCPISINKIKVHRSIYEKLHGNDLTNDDICEAIIKKSMEGNKDTSSSLKPELETKITRSKKHPASEDSPKLINEIQGAPEAKKGKVMPIKPVVFGPTNSEESGNDQPPIRLLKSTEADLSSNTRVSRMQANLSNSANGSSQDVNVLTKNNKVEENVKRPNSECKPFSIMDHVIMIKVNHVGLLYQCKLCNRNFLAEEAVLSHGCAKNGTAKCNFTKAVTPPEVPKTTTTVKYINTKTYTEANKSKVSTNINTNTSINIDNKNKEESNVKQKPKIGPASRVKKIPEAPLPAERDPAPPPASEKKDAPTSIQHVTAPNLNSRYKLVSGPNNTYTLVEVSGDAANKESKHAPIRKLKTWQTGL